MTVAQAKELAAGVLAAVADYTAVQVILAPPCTALATVSELLAGSGLDTAAQDMHWADQGAFTGAVSPVMVKELASHVILGHSERRHVFGETDADVNRKVHAAIAHDLVPILCVGETEDQRDVGSTDETVSGQLAAGFEGLAGDELVSCVVAYEPVWAIGTGRACDPEEAARVIGFIRDWLGDHESAQSSGMRVLYGGSVKPDNIAEYQRQPGIDGALVGGASLKVESFVALVRTTAEIAADSQSH